MYKVLVVGEREREREREKERRERENILFFLDLNHVEHAHESKL